MRTSFTHSAVDEPDRNVPFYLDNLDKQTYFFFQNSAHFEMFASCILNGKVLKWLEEAVCMLFQSLQHHKNPSGVIIKNFESDKILTKEVNTIIMTS